MSDITNKRKEKISAFLDDDMHRDELMSFSLSAEDDDAKTAQRYLMVGDALRGEMSDASFIDVSSAVREAIADETLAAPSQAAEKQAAEKLVVENTSSGVSSASADKNTGSFFDLSSWFKPVAGLAVAASVAVVMVVSLPEQGVEGVSPVAGNIVTTPAKQVDVQLATDAPADINANTNNPHIKQYLMDQHLEFAPQDTLQGRLPYVRAVSFESEDKPKPIGLPNATVDKN